MSNDHQEEMKGSFASASKPKLHKDDVPMTGDKTIELEQSFQQLVRRPSSTLSASISRSTSMSTSDSDRASVTKLEKAHLSSSHKPNSLFQQGLLRARPSNVAMYVSALLEDLWDDENFLETSHSYIQWLFPMSEGCGMNDEAFGLTADEAVEIATTPIARENMIHSFLMMARFFGFRMNFTSLDDVKDATTSAVFPSAVPFVCPGKFTSREVASRFRNWSATHNSLRIARIIRSLSETGNHSCAMVFVFALLTRFAVSSSVLHLGLVDENDPLKDLEGVRIASLGDSLSRFYVPALHPSLAGCFKDFFRPSTDLRQAMHGVVKKALESAGSNADVRKVIYSDEVFEACTKLLYSHVASKGASTGVHPSLFLRGLPSPSSGVLPSHPECSKLETPSVGFPYVTAVFQNLAASNLFVGKPEKLGHTQETLSRALAVVSKAGLAANPLIEAAKRMNGASSDSSDSPYVFTTPDFTSIRDADMEEAIVLGMQQQIAAIEAITNCAEPATLENTIVALELSSPLLDFANNVFSALVSANTSDRIQAIDSKLSPLLAAHSDAIFLNQDLFGRVKDLHMALPQLKAQGSLSAEDIRVVEKTYSSFVRAGAALSPQQRENLSKLNLEESVLMTTFSDRLLAATKAKALVVSGKDATVKLDGLSSDDLAVAKAAAVARGLPDDYVIVLSNTTMHPILGKLKHRPTRIELQQASAERCCVGGPNDTRELVSRLATLRAQKAFIFGKSTYSNLLLQHQMAGSEQRVRELISKTLTPALVKARVELNQLQFHADREVEQTGAPRFDVASADWDYFSDKVYQAEYEMDPAVMKPYFELYNVLVNGVFYVAEQLYGLYFRQITNVSTYHPDVTVYEVFETVDGKEYIRAIFYLDPYARDNKQGGAWCTSFIEQNGLTGARSVICNVENYTKPAVAGEPCLLDWEDIITLFHEAGHGLHGICSQTKYPSLAALNVPNDFVELPSQVNENWALHPEVLKRYAVHYQTGEPMPSEYVEKMKKAATFNKGYATIEYLQAALLDLAWHSLPAQEGDTPIIPADQVEEFEKKTLRDAGFSMEAIPVRYKSTLFSHVFCSMYSSSYYAYLWSELLDQDAYVWFLENGGLSRQAGQYFRDTVLSIGNTKDVAQAYLDFRGAEPDITHLLRKRGLLLDN